MPNYILSYISHEPETIIKLGLFSTYDSEIIETGMVIGKRNWSGREKKLYKVVSATGQNVYIEDIEDSNIPEYPTEVNSCIFPCPSCREMKVGHSIGVDLICEKCGVVFQIDLKNGNIKYSADDKNRQDSWTECCNNCVHRQNTSSDYHLYCLKRNCSLHKAIPAIIRTNFQRGLPLNYCEYFNKKNIGIDDDM